jgi:hypothetical protein
MESELIIPLFVVVSLAIIILFSLNRIYPAQFIGRGLFIPWWLDMIAYLVLIAIAGLYLQRPKYYEVTDDGIDVVYSMKRYRIPFAEIKQVQSVGERVARPLDEALLGGTFERIVHGLRLTGGFLGGHKIVPLPAVELNLTRCDIGGVQITCTDGRTAILTPAELSGFLNEVERQLRKQGIEAAVVRETRVQVT